MVEQYIAAAITNTIFPTREENLARLEEMLALIHLACAGTLPVRLVGLGEFSLQGYTDKRPTSIPGVETDFVGKVAAKHRCYIIGDLGRVQRPGIPEDRLFNEVFIVAPSGEVIYRRAKLQLEPLEANITTTPHDVWDLWVERYGGGLDALFPVVDTDIGRIGAMSCMEGSYPEIARGLALNGAEVLYRVNYHEPFVGNGAWELQNRARALDNTCFLVAPTGGAGVFAGTQRAFDIHGGHPMIIDYQGRILSQVDSNYECFAAAVIDVESLREYRSRVMGIGNFVKDLRTECYRPIYEGEVYPKNLRLKGSVPKREMNDPLPSEEIDVLRSVVDRFIDKGIWKAPARRA
jgi:predicted amidohydrolase